MADRTRFAELVSHLAREITRRQSSEVCCGDLTLEQFQTLRAVSGAGRMSMRTLSSQLRVDLSTMSRNVTRLARDGYLARSRSSEDGRVVQVGLTARGRRALASLRCDERDVLGDVYARLPAADRARVIDALEVIRTGLDRASGADGACCAPVAIRKAAS